MVGGPLNSGLFHIFATMKRIFSIVCLIALCVASGAAEPKTKTQSLVRSLDSGEILRSSVWSVLAVNAEGDTLAKWNESKRLSPASNMKLVTTGTSLLALGPDFRFETGIAYQGEIKDSTLKGDVYIIGGGDPTLGASYDDCEPVDIVFSRWEGMLEGEGIRNIDGRIIACPGEFAKEKSSGLWDISDLFWDYGAEPSGLCFFRNVQEFEVTPAEEEGEYAHVQVRYPATPWMKYIFNVRTVAPSEGTDINYKNTDAVPVGILDGNIALGRRPSVQRCTNRFPELTCAFHFSEFLKSRGHGVGGFADIDPLGNVRTSFSILSDEKPAGNLKVIGSTFSPELRHVIEDTNRESDNLYAETIWLMMGRERQKAVLDSLAPKFLDEIKIVDGSGLDDCNFLTTGFMVSYLNSMKGTSVFGDFFRSLPVPGIGTLKYMFGKCPENLRSRIHMKSGSISSVRSFSGYIESPDGDPSKMITFSIIINHSNVGTSAMTALEEKVIESLAREYGL